MKFGRIPRSVASWIAGTLVLGLLLSALSAWRQSERNFNAAREALDAASQRVVGQLSARMQLYDYGLRRARGAVLLMGERNLSWRVFREYSEPRELEAEFPGARGFGFIRKVPQGQEAAYLQQARRDVGADFSIREFGPNTGDRFITEYIEPLERNRAALGVDIASESNRRAAALTAARTGRTTITAPIALLQASGAGRHSMLLLLPIYRPGAPQATSRQREEALLGWSFAPLTMEEVLAEFRVGDSDVAVAVRDVSESGSASLIFESSTGPRRQLVPGLVQQVERSIYGRIWQIELQGDQQMVQRLGQLQPLTVLLSGLLATCLCAALMGALRIGRERQLRNAEHRAQLATIVENSSDAIVGESMDGRVFIWNRAAELLFGFSAQEAIGKPLRFLLLARKDQHQDEELLSRIAMGGAVEAFDARRQHRDGSALDMSITASAIRSPTGRVVGVAQLMRDNRERKEAERRLQEFNARLENEVNERTAELVAARRDIQAVLDAVPSMIGYWDTELRNRVANTAYCRWLGVPREEIAGRSLRELASAAAFEQVRPRIEAALRGEPQYFERTLPGPGGVGTLQTLAHYLPDVVDGEVRGFYAVVHDITEVKAAQDELARLATLLGSVLRSATEVAIIATDLDGRISLFNAGAEQLLGYPQDEVIGRLLPTAFHLPEELAAQAAALPTNESGQPLRGFAVLVHRALREGAETREWTYVRKNRSQVRVQLVVTTIRNEAGAVIGFLGMAHDVSERVRAEVALRQAKTAAEDASNAKSMFLANMSHEIRTPMNAVIGVAHLLESSPLTPDQQQLLGKLQIAGRSLMGIINDVLDVAKIEAGEMHVEHAPFSPSELLSELTQLFSPQVRAKHIALDVHGVDSLPPQLLGDGLRLRQILINLVSNAVKFTQHGAVTVRVRPDPNGDGRAWWRWSVSDTGVGISQEVVDKLFTPFVQADVSTTRRFGGTGLGLSIVRQLAQLMGGQVGVTSRLGQGSEFWVRLPFEVADERSAALAAAQGGTGLQVMVVDDSADDRRALAQLCHALGWRTVELGSGEEMVAYFKAGIAQGLPLPDALLVDWLMRGLDGLQALAELATLEPSRLPAALIISAHDREAIARLEHAALVDQILTKPVGSSELFNAVNKGVARHTGSTGRVMRATRMEALGAQWLAGLKILLVDDSEINLEVASRLLEREGAIVGTSLNGLDAIDQLRSAPERFDAVLMDVQMPIMDGYEATRQIRGTLGLVQLPVLALTAGALGDERRRALEAGMDDFLTKPLDPPVLVRAIRTAVERARGKPLALLSASGPTVEVEASDWPRIDGIDPLASAQHMSHDAALFLRMLDRLLREYRDLGAAGGAPLAGQRDELAARLHKLRGASGLLGANDLHQLAGVAERLLREGAEDEDCRAALVDVGFALAALAQAAQPVLAPVRSAAPAMQADGAPPASALAGEAVAPLLQLLKLQDLAAADEFERIAAQLAQARGAAWVGQLREAIDALDFAGAQALLTSAVDRT